MQTNTLTTPGLWADDILLPGGVNVVFDRFAEETNRSTYHGPNHTDAMREMMQLYRSTPKPSGESRGVKKTSVKHTTDVSVPNKSGTGDILLPLIMEVNMSVPVGTTVQATLEIRKRVAIFLLGDAATELMDKRSI